MMRSLLLLLLLSAPARAADLLSVLQTEDPARLLDAVVALGQRIALSDPKQVQAAIGPVRGLQTRGDLATGFVGYTNKGGEVVYNDRAEPGRIVLLVSPKRCIPLADIEARLRGPEFMASVRKSTVVLYSDAAFRDRRGMAFTYQYGFSCVGSFGLAEDRKRA